MNQETVNRFFNDQLTAWPEAAARFDALNRVETKTIDIDGFTVTVQFNPARIVSSAAKTDTASIKARPCFLCDANRPSQQQSITIDGYKILVNPFPIIGFHLTIPAEAHAPQLITGRLADMERVATMLPDCVIFYNGPRCGASAPDHFHFQAIPLSSLTLVEAVESAAPVPFGIIVSDGMVNESHLENVLKQLPRDPHENEPKINLFMYVSPSTGTTRTIIIPRRRHRPDFYGNQPGQMLVSPASIDLGGVMVAPRHEDFDMLDETRLHSLFTQLCYTQQEIDELIR